MIVVSKSLLRSKPPLTDQRALSPVNSSNLPFADVTNGASARSPALEFPGPLDDSEQESGGHTKQEHTVQCLQRSHELPAFFQNYVRMTVSCHRAQRVENGVGVIWQSTDNPVNDGPDRRLYPVHEGDRHRRGTDDHHEYHTVAVALYNVILN